MKTTDEWSVERCTVSRWDDEYVYGETAGGSVRLSGDAVRAARPLLREGMQLNIVEEFNFWSSESHQTRLNGRVVTKVNEVKDGKIEELNFWSSESHQTRLNGRVVTKVNEVKN